MFPIFTQSIDRSRKILGDNKRSCLDKQLLEKGENAITNTFMLLEYLYGQVLYTRVCFTGWVLRVFPV